MAKEETKKGVKSHFNLTRIVFVALCTAILVLFVCNSLKHHDSLPDHLRSSIITFEQNVVSTAGQIEDIVLHNAPHGSSPVLNNVPPALSSPLQNTRKVDTNPQQNSPYAYLTLISGIDSKFRYRGFLYNALIMRKALHDLGSTADFIALVGYSEKDITPFQEDIELLRSNGIITFTLPRLLDEEHALGFAEMALLKITPFSLTQYKKVQFLDGDVMPTRNMDCFFNLDKNTFTVGAVSPLNSGWYLGIPDMEAFNYMREKSVWRLGRDWDEIEGWAERMPKGLTYRGGHKPCEKWLFNGADMDQGLFAHYFILNHGNALLIDTDLQRARVFQEGLLHAPDRVEPMNQALSCCQGVIPTAHFVHFTGRSKPWLVPDLATSTKRDLVIWKKHLDSLNLKVNSSTIANLKLVPPLGFFNANFPKGGFK